jgi:glycosyltransferase involved in cell wall biosynthesis
LRIPSGAPDVSVIMPVRNAQRFVEAGVRSVLAQSHANFELLAIDDASTDATPQILDRLAATDGRIRVLRDGRLGLVGALNRGLAEARAALVARMDADDVAMPRRFELQMAALAAAPQLGVIGGQVAFIDADGRDLRRRSRHPLDHAAIAERLSVGDCVVAHPTVMARRVLLTSVGGYRAAFQFAEDVDLWLRVSERAPIANLAEILVRYRIHDGQVSERQRLRQMFATDLATRMAALRRSGEPDPTSGTTGPIDWNDADAASALGRPVQEIASLYAVMDRVYSGRVVEWEETALVEAKTAIDDARVGGVGSARRRHRVLSRLLRAALAQRRPVLTATLVRQMWREDPWRTLLAPWRRVKAPGLD